MKSYCQKCGSGTEYLYDKPKFCSGCGSSFSTLAASTPKPSRPLRNITQEIEEPGDKEIDIERMRSLSSLQIEIAHDSGHQKSKIGDLMGTRDSGPEPSQGTLLKVDRKEAMEAFKREAGFYPSKQSTNEEE